MRLYALRWILCLPSIFIGYSAGFLTALLILEMDERTCPAEYRISGTCMAPWSDIDHQAALIIGASIAAVLTVLMPALVAPAKKLDVSFAALFLGSGYACYLMWSTGTIFYISMPAAIAAGCLSFLLIRRRLGRFKK